MDDEFVRHFCKHLVVVCVTYEILESENGHGPKLFTCPGTIILLGNLVAVMIAGHAAKELGNLQKSNAVKIRSAELADAFSIDARDNHTIPIRLTNETIFAFEHGGLDFGFLLLDPVQSRLLEHNGILAVDKHQWHAKPEGKLDAFWMLGTPEEFVTSSKFDSSKIRIVPTMIPLLEGRVLTTPEPGKAFPRFIGKLPENYGVDSVVGMSGGPIFGFRKSVPNKYWIVAIQSTWIKSTRTVYASPLIEIGKLLDEWLIAAKKDVPVAP